MNASRVFGAFAAVLAVVSVFSSTSQARAQETLAPQVQATGPDYSYDSLEILAPYVAGDEESASLVFSLLLKNTSPDQRNYRLGVDFRNTAAAGSDRLYIARVPELYTVAGNAQERVEFTIPSPRFLSGVYSVSVGASDEKGNPVGMIRLDDMKFPGVAGVSLSDCTFSGQSLADGVRVKGGATAKADIACKASWSGEETNMAKLSVRLADFRYAPTSEVGQASASLSRQGSSVTISLANALPAGFYQLEIAPLDSENHPIGVPVRSPIAVEGVGGKIVSIADTAVMEKDGKSVVPVSVLTEAYDGGTYQLSLSLASEGQACAAPLNLPLDVTMNEVSGEFALTKECQYPVIMATFSDASGKKFDQAVRAFGERVPVRAAAVSAQSEGSSKSMMSWGLILLFSLPILVVIFYLARKRMRVTRMMPLFFAFAASLVFISGTGQVQAAVAGFDLNYYCLPDDPCPEATTIFVHYNVKDTFSPGEDIIIGQTIGSDDYPITPVTGGAFFGVNDANYTGNLDGKSYRAQELREGVFNDYRDVRLKAPMTPGTFTLSLGVTMSGYTNYYPKVVTLRVVGSKTECPAPGWGEPDLVYDGWEGSGPKWCAQYPNGLCTSGTGGNSPSTTGSVTSCCDAERSRDNLAWVRYCEGGKGGGAVEVTMTGKARQVGFWKQLTNSAEASGPAVNIPAGGAALLTWTSVGATNCTLTVPPVAGRDVALNATDFPVTGLSAGTHILTIDCRDASGTKTDSDFVTVNVNSAPNVPTITGPATGVTNTSYDYVMTSTDPDGDTLRYGFDGDGNGSVDRFYPSTGYVASGTGQTATKSWSTPGTYTIQASAQDSKGAGSNFTAKTITITNPVAAALNICPTSATINEGGSTQLAAWYTGTGVTFNGCAAPNGTNRANVASWSSSNSGVASVNATGRVSGVTPGTASIGATYSGVSDATPTSVTVLCTPKDSCSSQSSKDKADLVCTTDTFQISDGCGNNIVCNGARTCDYNWKEVAP